VTFTAELCRAKALECDWRAGGANSYEAKIQYHDMAQQWRSMAQHLERLHAEGAGENGRFQLAGTAWTGKGRAGK
jgi:hypothetical protein